MGDVGVGDLLPGLDGLLREEDLDLVVIVVPMSSVRDTSVVDTRQAQAKDLEKRETVAPSRKSMRNYEGLVRAQRRHWTKRSLLR